MEQTASTKIEKKKHSILHYNISQYWVNMQYGMDEETIKNIRIFDDSNNIKYNKPIGHIAKYYKDTGMAMIQLEKPVLASTLISWGMGIENIVFPFQA